MDVRTKTVLIVEDNELNMKLFHDLLDAHGYNILQTKDGMEALDIAREQRPEALRALQQFRKIGRVYLAHVPPGQRLFSLHTIS